MKLSDLKTGEKAVVVKVSGHGSFRKRITEMGFIKGSSVKAVMNAPLKDPIEYEIMGYRISLRREEAAMIEILSYDEAKSILSQEKGDTSSIDASDCQDEQIERLADERSKTLRVALVGNPNCGKTSLFNIASGAHEHVGNYSGVTVDAKEGTFEYGGYKFVLVDLPGTYSLSAFSPEELYVRRNLIDNVPDVVINVVDASNLQRNLYLTTQVIDMNLRMVIALNMYDELTARGDKLDISQLGNLLGVPVVPTVSRTGEGIDQLFEIVIKVYENKTPGLTRHIHVNHGAELEQSIDRIKLLLQQNPDLRRKYSTRYLAIKYIENDSDVAKVVESLPNRDEIISARYEEQNRIRSILGTNAETAIVEAKYAFVQGALAETWEKGHKKQAKENISEKIDAVVTNKWAAFPIFILLLFIIFQATFTLGDYPVQWIQWCVDKLGEMFTSYLPNGWVKDLIVNGVIGGVGSVLVFLPNILLLYFFISLLEDSGYMARAAFIMDKLMHKMGLHGKSFIPMVMGFGCNVPAIMACRTIESRKSRLITIMVLPFMSCSGRLPVFVMLTTAFFSRYAAVVLLGLYLLGIIMAILSAKLLSFFIKDDDLPFVMELPPYRIPTAKAIFRHTWEKGREYLRKMGGVILICSIIVWALGYFPNHDAFPTEAIQQENSYLGYIGKAIEPVLAPLGFDWKMDIGILAGVGAKELIVSTLGVLGTEPSTAASALAYMVFILLYLPCVATVIAIRNETGSWKWALLSTVYGILVAWLLAFGVYHIALLF